MIKIHWVIAFLFLGTLFSCSDESDINSEKKISIEEEEDHRPNLHDFRQGDYHLDFPLDTAQLIANMNLIDYVDRTDLIDTDPEKELLSDTIDTLMMLRIAYACVCPNWYEIGCEDTFTNQFSGPCQYYIEPAHEELQITVPYVTADHLIRFIGKKYLEDVKDEGMGEASHGGQKFKYYSFEFIKPYKVYGPCYNDTMFSKNGRDTILNTANTYLTVD